MTYTLTITPPEGPPRCVIRATSSGAQGALVQARALHREEGTTITLDRDGARVEGYRWDGKRWREWPRTDGGKPTTHTAQLALRCAPEERRELEAAGLTGRRAVDVLLREARAAQ